MGSRVAGKPVTVGREQYRETEGKLISDSKLVKNRSFAKLSRGQGVMEDVIAVVPHIPSHLHELTKPCDHPASRRLPRSDGGQVAGLNKLPAAGGKTIEKGAPADQLLVETRTPSGAVSGAAGLGLPRRQDEMPARTHGRRARPERCPLFFLRYRKREYVAGKQKRYAIRYLSPTRDVIRSTRDSPVTTVGKKWPAGTENRTEYKTRYQFRYKASQFSFSVPDSVHHSISSVGYDARPSQARQISFMSRAILQ
jgi:hypothetical protein